MCNQCHQKHKAGIPTQYKYEYGKPLSWSMYNCWTNSLRSWVTNLFKSLPVVSNCRYKIVLLGIVPMLENRLYKRTDVFWFFFFFFFFWKPWVKCILMHQWQIYIENFLAPPLTTDIFHIYKEIKLCQSFGWTNSLLIQISQKNNQTIRSDSRVG